MRWLFILGDTLILVGLIGIIIVATTGVSFWIGWLICGISFPLFMFGLDITINEAIDRKVKELKDEIK